MNFFDNRQKLSIILILFCILNPFILILLGRNYNNSNSKFNGIITIATTIDIEFSSTTGPLDDGSFLKGSKITFVVDKDSYPDVNIKLLGDVKGRSFEYNLTLEGNKWRYTWDTNDPTPEKGESKAVDPDTYKITLTINSVDYSTNPGEIVISTGEEPFPLLLIIVIISSIIGGVGVSASIVMRKRSRKAEELEFGAVDKEKKKKGDVYKGASTIGKRSGELAESRHKSKTKALEKEGSEGKARIRTGKKKMMPAIPGFEFETRASTGAAMIKDMEKKLDIDSKMNFTLSKVEAILQNIEFFKAILLQQEQKELKCPKCDKIMTLFWAICPYCEIAEHDELGLKQSLLTISGDIKFCPDCKRIIRASWGGVCPFCFVKNRE